MPSDAALTVSLGEGRSYPMHVAPLGEVPARMKTADLRAGRCLVVTDENVASRYRTPLVEALETAGWTPHVVVLPPGEETKSVAPLRELYDQALDWGLDRRTPVVALGGGVIGDLAGFAAATLLRGLPLVHVPTSLVAQVDASLGGKTGINHPRGKNLIGAFWQPRLVAADPHTLATLPEREWRGGLAEVVKHALIEGAGTTGEESEDGSLRAFLDTHRDAITGRRPEAVAAMIPKAARVKARIVEADEREAGLRAVLNFGHTFGHAVERAAGYGAVTHGEAVALGMRAALVLSRRRAGLPRNDVERAWRLTQMVAVPPEATRPSLAELRAAMQSDKKNVGDTVRFVLLRGLGDPEIVGGLSDDDLSAAWSAACESARAAALA
jgi:3-dehydroquinate synthase